MKKSSFIILPVALSCLLASCGSEPATAQVISTRYVHKYGYTVSKEDWEKHRYPGHVITTLRDGVTITATYENGQLNGPTTHTYPNSQTVHHYFLYNQGSLVKELTYDIIGMPTQERLQLSPQRYSLTSWYQDGTPKSIENFANEELIEGEYLTQLNEIESRVEHGTGQRISRNPQGILLAKDQIENGFVTKRETFYASGMPESYATFVNNKLSGEKKVFAETGEPVVLEEWVHGKLHGKATYFAGGVKQSEIYYLNGMKNGPEIHFVDGEKVAQEILWSRDKRQGPTKYYIDGALAQTEWYYNGEQVSKRKYDESHQLDQLITQTVTDFNESVR